mgnify:CR=1 FL=1
MSIAIIITDTGEAYNINWKLDTDCTGLHVSTSEDTDITYYLDSINTGMYRVIKVVDSNAETYTYKHPKSVVAFIGRYENCTLVQNSLYCPRCDTTLVSHSQHDFKGCNCPASTKVWIDGGNSYSKRSGDFAGTIDLNLYSSQSHEVLREHCCRGGRGIDGRQPLTWVKIKDINDNWLNSLITYCEDLGQYGSIHYLMYLDELEYRKTHKIIVTGE